ncbi:MAG: fimbrillin family protein [Tannerellaceae bacterium]
MKRFVFGLATCAIALASCSTNDVLEQGSGSNNPNVINFSATTTRATVNNLDDVKKGFPVYAVTTKKDQGADALAWHINGLTYKFEGNTWKWFESAGSNTAMVNGPQWPALNTFPMNFYAYYPATAAGFNPNAVTVGTLTGAFTINSTAATQIDFLAANSTGITRPMATVPLAFMHITTKINFGVKAAAGTKSYIQQLNINNVKNQGTYDYVTKNDWTIEDKATLEAKYDYWGTATANTSDEGAKEIKDFSCATNGTEVAAPFYNAESTPTAAAAHLMLLPQSETPVWEPVKTSDVASITPDKAYIGSVYRMTDGVDGNEKDLVGFAKAEDHPNYVGSVAQKNQYTGALFVKVGFPLATESDPKFSWIMGKAYTYNIALGQLDSSGGYILDNRYYDDKGNPTDLTIDGKNPGDPVLKGEIHFHVTVGDWEDANPQPDPIN